MKKIKSFFSRVKDEKGFGILGLITVIGLISFAVGTVAFKEYAEKANEKVENASITIQNLDVPGDTSDANEAYNTVVKTISDASKEGLKYGVNSVFDETGGLGIVKETGIYDIPKDKKKEQENSDSNKEDNILIQGLMGAVAEGAEGLSIEEKLDENNLPTSAITQDITKIIINVANQLGSSDSEIEEIIDTGIDVVKDLTNKDKDENIDDDSSKTLEIVKEKLSEKNILEDEEIINKRKEYNLSALEKKQLEKEIEAYKYYQNTDTIIISDKTYIKIQQRLDYLNGKIDALEKELEENSKKVSEDQSIEDTSTDEEVSEETSEDTIKAATINLKIIAGPTYSEADGVCYYRVKAYVTGDPYPGITFSKDSSGGAWGASTVQINLKDGGSYTLKATATNSEGSATDSIYLSWGCAVEDTSTGGGGSTSTDDGETCPYE